MEDFEKPDLAEVYPEVPEAVEWYELCIRLRPGLRPWPNVAIAMCRCLATIRAVDLRDAGFLDGAEKMTRVRKQIDHPQFRLYIQAKLGLL